MAARLEGLGLAAWRGVFSMRREVTNGQIVGGCKFGRVVSAGRTVPNNPWRSYTDDFCRLLQLGVFGFGGA
jgi:hypothetical protein